MQRNDYLMLAVLGSIIGINTFYYFMAVPILVLDIGILPLCHVLFWQPEESSFLPVDWNPARQYSSCPIEYYYK